MDDISKARIDKWLSDSSLDMQQPSREEVSRRIAALRQLRGISQEKRDDMLWALEEMLRVLDGLDSDGSGGGSGPQAA